MIYLMNPKTGSVDTLEGWYPYSEKDGLIEVRETVTEEEKKEWGEWMEID